MTNHIIPFNYEIAQKFKDYIHAMIVHYVLFESVNKRIDCIEDDNKVFVKLSKTTSSERFPGRKQHTVKDAANELVLSGVLESCKFKNTDYFAINPENAILKHAYENQKDFLKLTNQSPKKGKIENYQQFFFPRLDYGTFYGLSPAIIIDRFMFLLAEGNIKDYEPIKKNNNLFLHLSKSDLVRMFPGFLAYDVIINKLTKKSRHIISGGESFYGLNVNLLSKQNWYSGDKKFKKLIQKIGQIQQEKEAKLVKKDKSKVKIDPTLSENRPDFGENRPDFGRTHIYIINNLRVESKKKSLKRNRRTSFLHAKNSSSISLKNFVSKNLATEKKEKFYKILQNEKMQNLKFKNFTEFQKSFYTSSAEGKKLFTQNLEFFNSGFDLFWGSPLSPDFPEGFEYLGEVYKHLHVPAEYTSLQISENSTAKEKALYKISSLKALSCQLLMQHNAILQLGILNGVYEAIKLKEENMGSNAITQTYVLQILANALQGDGGIISGRYVWPMRWKEFNYIAEAYPEIDFSAIRAYDVSDIINCFVDLPEDHLVFVLSTSLEKFDEEDLTYVKKDLEILEDVLATQISLQEIIEYA